VFPAFLFGVGMALALPFPKVLDEPGERARLWRRVVRRGLGLIVLGLMLNWLTEAKDSIWFHDPGAGTLAHVRIPGVLQRIALCYLIGVVLIVTTARKDADGRRAIDPRAIVIAAAALLLGYWTLMTFVPVPGFGAGRLDQAGNLAAYIDRAAFTPMHMWRYGSLEWAGPVLFDPEGLLSTLTATVNLLFGVLAAVAWQRAPAGAPLRIAAAGAALMAAGLLLYPVFPVNKLIWTSSFALVSGGFSALVLAAIMLAMRSDAAARIAAPLRVLGGNAVLAFTLSILLGIFGNLPILRRGEAWITPQEWGDGIALGLFGEPYIASLACACAILALITLAIWPLHRRSVHLRL